MPSHPRFAAGFACKILGIIALISLLFVTGCTTSGNSEAQLAVATLSGGLPAGSVSVGGGVYPSTTLSASGGTAPYTWAVTSGNFPGGLVLSASGTISGSPTAAGTFNFTVTVTDSASHTASGNLSITINGVLTITTAAGTLPTTGEVGSAFAATSLAESGGVGPFNWVINSGSLPANLGLSATGSISGTISSGATPGTFSFTVKVTDSQGNVAVSGTISIKVDAALLITPPTFPVGVVGVSYASPAFTASGGSLTGYTFAVVSGSLSPLSVGSTTGIITGTPLTSGTLQFGIKVTDSLGYTATTSNLSITVNPAITVALLPTSPVTLDQSGTQLITATVTNDPNTAGVNWALTSGLGSLSGQSSATTVTYNAPASVAVASAAVITATSKTDPSKSASFTVNLVPPPQITTTTLASGTAGFPYTGASVSMTGGVAPYAWLLVTGPAGISLGTSTTNTISLQGTPTTAGTNQPFTVKVTDAQGLSVTSSGLTITVLLAPAISTFTPAAATITAGGSTTLTATFSNGTGSVNNGVGAVTSGTPVTVTPSATTTYTLTVTDTAGASVTQQTTVTVVPAPVIASFTPAAATITAGGSTTLTAVFTGGTGSINNGVGAVTNGAPATVSPSTNTTYTLTVTNSATTPDVVTLTATVTVVPAPMITSFTPAAGTITAGGSTTLTAVFTGGTGSVNNGVGPVTNGTPVTVSPSTTTTYTLTVTNSATTPASVTAMTTVTVDVPPQITSANNTTFTVGSNGTFTVMTTGKPTAALSEVGTLPGTVTFVDNHDGTATISGIPSGAANSYPITITANNGISPNAVQIFTLNVVLVQAPSFTSASGSTFTLGVNSTFTVMSNGSPTPALTKVGSLPNGINFVDNGNGTATVSGTPAAGTIGSYPITITANNGVNPNAQQTFTLGVVAAPVITSFTPAAATITAGGSTTLTAVFTGGTGSINNGVGAVTNGTPATVSPSITTTYTLTVTNSATTPDVVTLTATVTVVAAPVITSFAPATGTITAGGSTTLTAVFTGGTGSINNGVGPVTNGAPVTVSPSTNTTYTLTVTNSATTPASVTAMTTVTVDVPPQITSANSASFSVNTTGSFTVTTTGNPLPSLSEVGTLPGTFTFVDNGDGTATIHGTAPATGGSFPITITAHNGAGSDFVQNFTLTITTGPASVQVTVQGVIFANGNTQNILINVTNDLSGDVLTPTLTLNGGGACTTATCGTLGSVSGTLNSYTLPYTPPTSANLTATTTYTLTVSSSLANSFTATANFTVNPAGAIVVTAQGPGASVPANGATSGTLFVRVYNDVTREGAAISLLGSGYACPSNGPGTLCGTLNISTPTFLTTTAGTTGIPYTQYSFTYTNPNSLPNPPYNRPMILAVSNANPTKTGNNVFQIGGGGSGIFANSSKLNTALAGSTPLTLTASIGGDTGNSKTLIWTLTSSGTNCQPTCGVLGTLAYTRNGNNVTGTITYTPPATVPSGATASPTITVESADNNSVADSFNFQIVSDACATGNESLLNGQYAFLLKGGGATIGYGAVIGSFTADGAGHITTGSFDFNQTTGVTTGLSVVSAASSYSVGSDNRGCLTLANSSGGTDVFRIALGTVSGGAATQGQIVVFTDATGQGRRLQGVLMKQIGAPYANTQISGNYVFGDEGIDSQGGRIVVGGVTTANGSGGLSNFDTDTDDNGFLDSNDQLGSGTYSVNSTTGRGTGTFTRQSSTSNTVLYIVSTTEVLSMTTDTLSQATPILSGDYKKQTVSSFTGTETNGSGYAFYAKGIGNNGGDDITIGQSAFTTNGNATLTLDENNNGTEETEQIAPVTFTIASNGRMILSGAGNNPPIFYLVGPTGGYIVGTDNSGTFGFVEQQTGGPFSTASITGQFFFGGNASTTGQTYDSGTVTFVAGSPSGTITGNDDFSGPNGLGVDLIKSPGNAYCFLTSACTPTPTAPGQGSVGSQSLAYIISPSKIIFLQTSTVQSPNPPEIFIIQK